jgi:hypothetical protein
MVSQRFQMNREKPAPTLLVKYRTPIIEKRVCSGPALSMDRPRPIHHLNMAADPKAFMAGGWHASYFFGVTNQVDLFTSLVYGLVEAVFRLPA